MSGQQEETGGFKVLLLLQTVPYLEGGRMGEEGGREREGEEREREREGERERERERESWCVCVPLCMHLLWGVSQ